MKTIKITESNSTQIESALHEVNGKSTAHTYTAYAEIKEIAKRAEQKLTALIPKSYGAGSCFVSESGDSVANKYKGSRNSTTVKIERKSNGFWYLTKIEQGTLYTDGGKEHLYITEPQKEKAIEALFKNFTVIKTN